MTEASIAAVRCSKGSFLLSNAVQNISNIKTGSCPHGLTPGACPICSNMGGGGSLRVGERPQKVGEMSYHECTIIGAMMKARELAAKAHDANLQQRAAALLQFQQNLEKMVNKMLTFSNQISKNFILKPVAYTINNIVVPILQGIKNIPNIITNFAEKISDIKQKLFDIQDKLNAIFGEVKAFVDKKVSELVSNLKSKLKTLFNVKEKDETKDEDNKIDEDKKIFNLKKVMRKLFTRKKKDDTTNHTRS